MKCLLLYYWNTLVDVSDDSSGDDNNDENDDNTSEIVAEREKSASKETTPDQDAQVSEANTLTPTNYKNAVLEDQQEVSRRNKDCQNKKNLQNPKRNQMRNFWKK